MSVQGTTIAKKALGILLFFSAVASASFKYTGVVEGFYGTPYSFQARKELMSFLADHGMNLYLYGPKNDPYHREKWRMAYPEKVQKHFQELILLGEKLNVTFCYALSPGLDIRYASKKDRKILIEKLERFLKMGARCLGVLFDDIPAQLSGADRKYYRNPGEAQADLLNEVFNKLRIIRKGLLFIVLPTEYAGTNPSPYKTSIRRNLHPDVLLMWTGRGVVNKTITTEETKRFHSVYGRKPLIWDNYPANDFALGQLFLGPYQGRDPGLGKTSLGILSNPMIQPYASQIPLHTFALFSQAPLQYDPQKAWFNALQLFGKEAGTWLYELASQVQRSKLGHRDDVSLRKLVNEFHAAVQSTDRKAIEALIPSLRLRLQRIAQSEAMLERHLGKHPLWQELSDYVQKLAAYAKAGLLLLAALEKGADKATLKAEFDALIPAIEKSSVHLCRPACQTLYRDARRFFAG